LIKKLFTPKPDPKSISLLSNNFLSELRRKKIGFIFQQYNLLPMLTAKENIILPSLMDKDSYDRDYFKDLTETMAIADRLNHLPGELSGGQQQRVAVARALINKPAILLADEPTGNLDKKTAFELLETLLLSIKKYNQTLVVITHDPDIARRADRIFNIDGGVLREEQSSKI
jgi:putative ABC transport system ATP-binding protein